MEIGIAEITIISLVITEIMLTWRIWKLERRLMQTMEHFIKAKEFLGGIEKHVKDYRGVADGVLKNGVTLKLKSERFGALELDLKKQDDKEKKQ